MDDDSNKITASDRSIQIIQKLDWPPHKLIVPYAEMEEAPKVRVTIAERPLEQPNPTEDDKRRDCDCSEG